MDSFKRHTEEKCWKESMSDMGYACLKFHVITITKLRNRKVKKVGLDQRLASWMKQKRIIPYNTKWTQTNVPLRFSGYGLTRLPQKSQPISETITNLFSFYLDIFKDQNKISSGYFYVKYYSSFLHGFLIFFYFFLIFLYRQE